MQCVEEVTKLCQNIIDNIYSTYICKEEMTMLNVTVHPLIFPKFVMEGYWFDFEDCKTTFRNKENKPLFEVIHNQRTHEN